MADKKCSRCKKYKPLDNFGYKLNGSEFKTCVICRKKNINIPNMQEQQEEEADLDHIEIKREEIDFDHIERNKGLKQVVFETVLSDDGEPIVIDIKNDYNMNKLIDFLEYNGYNIIEYNDEMFLDICGIRKLEQPYENSFIYNKLAMLIITRYNINILLPSDNSTISLINVSDLDMVDNFTNYQKYKNKKRCNICHLKDSKKFKCCGRCNGSMCHICFNKITEHKIYACPFCRNTMKSHIESYIIKNKIDPDEIIKYTIDNIENINSNIYYSFDITY